MIHLNFFKTIQMERFQTVARPRIPLTGNSPEKFVNAVNIYIIGGRTDNSNRTNIFVLTEGLFASIYIVL
jgi:hypothetical protein